VKLFTQRDITFEDYLTVCAEIVRSKTNSLPPISALGLMARRDVRKGWAWSSSLKQAERVAQIMMPEERLDPAQMDVARRKNLAAQSGLRQHRVDHILRHFVEVRELASTYQRASLRDKFQLRMRNDPLIQWLGLRFGLRPYGN